MQTVRIDIARPFDACWRVFTDAAALTAWVPGLRDARIIEDGPDGLPREIQFEFGASLIYSLLYDYDLAEHVIHWEPRPGEHGAVRGHARFDPLPDGGTCLTYALEHEPGRKALDRAIDDPRLLADAFARLMSEQP